LNPLQESSKSSGPVSHENQGTDSQARTVAAERHQAQQRAVKADQQLPQPKSQQTSVNGQSIFYQPIHQDRANGVFSGNMKKRRRIQTATLSSV